MSKVLSRRSRVAPALCLAFALAPGLASAQPLPEPAPPPSQEPAPSLPANSLAPSPESPPPVTTPAQAPASEPGVAAAEPSPASPAVSESYDAEAAAIEAELQGATGGEDGEFKLNLYGFADFTYTLPLHQFGEDDPIPSFYVGKLNLYAAAELGDGWRSLSEVRFMYLPHGVSPRLDAADQTRLNTTVTDYTDYMRPVRWGGISIERAWLEHTFHPSLTVRVGQWLTPYGIWNVDHGSPVIIPVHRPYIIGESLFPERQTGIEAYGTLSFGPSQLGYHLTLSNGRGPIDAYQDLDHNKAIGGRLFFKHDSKYGVVTLGASGYRGKYSDVTVGIEFGPDGAGTYQYNVVERYDELSLAADLKWEWQGLLVQGEVAMNDVAYAEAHHPLDPGFGGGPPGFTPDHRKFGAYGLAGYRTSFFGIMPFAGAEYFDPGPVAFSSRSTAYMGGINARPTPRVVLKAEFVHAEFLDIPALGALNAFDFQAAWGF